MHEDLPLTNELNRYTRGDISRKDLEGHVFHYILDHYQEYHPYGWDRDMYLDYVCSFYPRIRTAIDNYRDRGSSFDAYIGSLLRWGTREYRTRETDHRATEYACWKAKALDDAAVHEQEDVYMEQEPAFDEVANPRQVLALVLKSYHYMSPDFLARIAPALNITPEALGHLVDELRKLRLQREAEIRAFQEQIYSQFYRCIVYEGKLKNLSPDTVCYKKLSGFLIRGRKRLAAMRNRLDGMKTAASNRQVAQILELSKGTVDAQVATIKRRKDDGTEPLHSAPVGDKRR